jgi:bifunctional oligoribonuclease and PAP phosphatase NrnA
MSEAGQAEDARSHMAGEVLRQIERHDHFVLTSHARPDGDAVGSALACSQILHTLGKHAEIVLHDGVPAIYGVLPFAETVVHSDFVKDDYEAAIILECDSLERTALQGFGHQFLINIDHHFTGRPFAHVNWIDPRACATAEMVFRLARLAGVPISPEMATCLYTGLLTDTGSFCFTGTSQSTFALARELVRCGADPVSIAQNVYFSHPTSKMRLLGSALSSLHRDGNLAWMFVTRTQMDTCGAMDEDCEGLVNYALGIEGIEVAAFFRELADRRRWRVSLRSKGHVNVAEIAERFGGGGHACASGFSMSGPLSVAAERTLAQLRIKLQAWSGSVQ